MFKPSLKSISLFIFLAKIRILFFLLSSILLFTYTAIAQNYDSVNVKPSKEIKKSARKSIDSICKNMTKNNHDTIKTQKKIKNNKIYVYTNADSLRVRYKLGDADGKIIVYNSSSEKIGEYDFTGSGKSTIIHDMKEGQTYFYEVYINGELIKTGKVSYFDNPSPPKKIRL